MVLEQYAQSKHCGCGQTEDARYITERRPNDCTDTKGYAIAQRQKNGGARTQNGEERDGGKSEDGFDVQERLVE
jgi:hypothetical protein